MNYRKLPKTDLYISEIGFGCMSLDIHSDENEQLIRSAIDLGINYFDTADLYDKGANEALIGKVLSPVRDKILIATKVGNEWLPDGSGWKWNPTKEHILRAVDKSLERLKTDYIDLYQLHGGTMEDNREEVIEAFHYLKKQGKIRHYGISSIRPNVINAYTQESNIVSDMLQYSLLDRRPEETVLDLLETNDIGVMARGSLAKGLLPGKPTSSYLNYSMEEVAAVQQKLKDLSSSDRNEGQIALLYTLYHSAITSAIVGFRTLGQLNDLISEKPLTPLSTDEYNQLQDCVAPAVYEDHRI